MRQPCDEALIRSTSAGYAPCAESARPWVLAATILGSSMAFIDGTVVNVALPALQSSLHATVVDVQWIIEAYGLFLSALILAGGALGDSIGRRLVFLAGAAIFAGASIACGLSSTIAQLLIARCVQGVGAAAMVPGSLAIISASFDDESRGRAIGTWSGFTAMTTAFGPVLGGYLIEHASWHWVFLINAPIAVVVIAISLKFVPESRNPEAKKVDWLGAVVTTLGLAGIVFGFLESSTLGWRNPLVYGPLVLGCVLLVFFIYLESHVSAPMLPLDLFRSRNFSGANLLTLLLYSALGVFFFVFPLNMIQVQGYSATATGAASLPFILLMFLLSRWSGGLVNRYGARMPLIVGPLIASAGFLLFARSSQHSTYLKVFLPAFLVLGLGMAISVAPLTTVVMNSVSKNLAGTASGINNTVARVAGVLAIAMLGPVMVHTFGHVLEQSLRQAQVAPELIAQLRANQVDLAGLRVPATVDAATAQEVQSAIGHAFIVAYRLIMAVSAALAASSAGVALRMISPR